jgi:DNA-binding transcriptional LysR family regulator
MRKLDQLNIFLRVVERGSFVDAARQLGLPAPTVSRTMRQFEARLGAELLRRTTRNLAVTETGQMVYEAVARGLAAIEEAELIAQRQNQTPAGTLRVLVPSGVGHISLEPLLRDFRYLCPSIRLALTLNNDLLDIVTNGFDVAFRTGELKDSSYAMRNLFRCPYRLVAAPNYLETVEIPKEPSEIQALMFLGQGEPHPGQDYTFVRGDFRQHVKLKPWLLCNDVTIVLNQALRGSGIAILPELLARAHLNSGKLISILSDWELDFDFRLSLIFTPHSTQDQKVRTFIDFIVSKFRLLSVAMERNSASARIQRFSEADCANGSG